MSKYKKSDYMKMRAKQFENLKKFPSLHPSKEVFRYWDEELQKYYFL